MIEIIVEGYGDVEAVPILLRRLSGEIGAHKLTFGRPQRRPRAELVDKDRLQGFIGTVSRQDCSGILIVFDADDEGCPPELAGRIRDWVKESRPNMPCEVVLAVREYEAWLLAGIRGISPEAIDHDSPEMPRDPKRVLGERLGFRYKETSHQPSLSHQFDLPSAIKRCRSFRRMVHAFWLLAVASGVRDLDWPRDWY